MSGLGLDLLGSVGAGVAVSRSVTTQIKIQASSAQPVVKKQILFLLDRKLHQDFGTFKSAIRADVRDPVVKLLPSLKDFDLDLNMRIPKRDGVAEVTLDLDVARSWPQYLNTLLNDPRWCLIGNIFLGLVCSLPSSHCV